MYAPDEMTEMKRRFAAALLLTPTEPDRAVASIEPRTAYANYILEHWQLDAEVQEFMRVAIVDQGSAGAHIPSKEEFAAQLFADARECKTKDLKLDYLKLFASVMGYVVKPAETAITNNVVVDNRKVIMIPEPPTDIDAWEASVMADQAKLGRSAS